MNAMWMGRMFCEEIATHSNNATSSHFSAPPPLVSCRPTSTRALSARAWARPERAMATAKAPSNA
ncbi:hypothetical protein D3C76_1850640 [compost metagenome]